MTHEEISRIAITYSDRAGLPIDFVMDVESVLEELSEDFCIVPKEQVYMRLGVANALMEQDPARKEFYRGMSSAIVSIFGKDTFEEEGK